ncbi:C45 family autoproteolytic acyltransferase/hydolase [Leucobacter ruminantium]|uniref:Peptidase C45 n=1 Tax=Leucobacter ruminantium TaxID=1289170 RepID=A0A939M3R6_9MICO|nr:C45 family peptidase [Leucobacter ruminantium]MBO1806430.1 peptidase C45 [Leucobacter ruminantium]
MTAFTFYGIVEDRPGERWRALFDAVWPGYRAWYLRDGDGARPDLATAERMLRLHMPELVPTWERLVSLTGGDETAARMLTLWNPPRFLPGCSQVAVSAPEPVLLRNYDYGLELFEQVHSSTRYGSRRVIGTSDCLWGLLDGMNEDGLAISLAFGGRPGDGDGFAAPLVVRYLLEVAGDVAEALRRLETIPVSMFYNLSMVDVGGETATAYVGPGMRPEVTRDPVATNHRGRHPEYPEHARRFRSVERQELLTDAVERDGADGAAAAMLGPEAFSHDYDNAFGTLYTAVYRPRRGEVEYLWHSRSWTRTLTSTEETIIVTLDDDAPEPRPTPAQSTAGAHAPGAAGAEAPGSAPDGAGSPPAGGTSVAELQAAARQAVRELSLSPDPAAFSALLTLSGEVGEALGASARLLAEHNSWARVAEIADVSRQAAWHRWR